MAYLNSRGDVAHGVGGNYLCLNNAPVARGWALGWLDDDTVAFCNGADGWRVSVYDVPMQSIAPLPQVVSANVGYCGGGYATWWLGSQDSTRGLWSTTGFRQPDAGLVGMGPDGSIAYRPDYHGAGPTLIHELDGTDWTLTDNMAEYLSSQGQRRVLWLEEGRPKVRNLPPIVCLDGTLWLAQAAFCGGQWWVLYISENHGVVLHPFGSLVGYAHAPMGDAWPTMRALTDRMLRVATSRTQGEQAGDVWVRDYDVVSNLVRNPWGDNVWTPIKRTDLGASVTLPSTGPVLDTSGQPFDMLPYFIGGQWPHTSKPGDHNGTLDCVHDPAARTVTFVKWENPACRETYRYDDQWLSLHEDRTDELSDSGRNAWHLTDGRWCPRVARVGDVIDAPGNQIERFGPAGVRTSIAPFAYRNEVVAHYSAYPFGGDVGTRECVVLRYDPTFSQIDHRGNYELFYYCLPFGWVRWESRDYHGDTIQQVADMTRLGGHSVTPASLIVPLPSMLPTGVDVLYPNGELPVLSRTGTHRLMDIRVPPCPVPVRVRVELVEGSLHGQIDTMDGTRIGRSGKQRPVEIR
jgi:hypothetical protein